jgi:hypothetical protein
MSVERLYGIMVAKFRVDSLFKATVQVKYGLFKKVNKISAGRQRLWKARLVGEFLFLPILPDNII